MSCRIDGNNNYNSGSGASAGASGRQLAWRLENLEEKIDRLTDLCYKGLNDPSKRPPTRPKCPPCPLPDDEDLCPPLAPRALSTTDFITLDGLDRYAVIGEILFQFERRVFNFVVPKNQRFYGYAVRNIEQLISREEDVTDRCTYRYNLEKLNNKLKPLGYLPYYHSELSCSIINEYGVLARSASEIRAMSTRLENIPFLKRLITSTIPLSLRDDVLTIYNCLVYLCDLDCGKVFRF